MNTLTNSSIMNLCAALVLAVLYGGGCLRYRSLGKRVAAGEFHLSGIRLRCLLWTWCFGVAVVGFLFVNYTSFQLNSSDYLIAALGALVGVFYIWGFDIKRDIVLGRMSAIPFGEVSEDLLFFSYKSDDSQLVRFIAEQMVASGQSVWFNEYRIILGAWENAFEVPLRKGVDSATRALFFTNAKWAMSKWCTDIEAKPLLTRRPKIACLEVRIPPGPEPYLAAVTRAMDDSSPDAYPYIDVHERDRWTVLRDVAKAMDVKVAALPATELAQRPLMGQVNCVNYELNIAGWTTKANAKPSRGNLILPSLSRVEDGIRIYVNIVVGKVGGEHRKLDDPEERVVFTNMRSFAKKFFEHFPFAGRCVGVHLVWHAGLSHGAFTYWGGHAWCRKYDIVLPASDGGADIAFHFTCAVYADFKCFCRYAWLFDDLVASLSYGEKGSDD